MGEKIETSRQYQINVEWTSVTKILSLKSYEQADIMLGKYLLNHSQDDKTIMAKLSILFRDAGMYSVFCGESVNFVYNLSVIDQLIQEAPTIVLLTEQLPIF